MRTHPITGMNLEDGHGALPDHIQAARHCDFIEKSGDKARADEVRKELGISTSEEKVAAAGIENDTIDSHHDRLEDHHARLTALEQNAAEHKALHDRIAALELAILPHAAI